MNLEVPSYPGHTHHQLAFHLIRNPRGALYFSREKGETTKPCGCRCPKMRPCYLGFNDGLPTRRSDLGVLIPPFSIITTLVKANIDSLTHVLRAPLLSINQAPLQERIRPTPHPIRPVPLLQVIIDPTHGACSFVHVSDHNCVIGDRIAHFQCRNAHCSAGDVGASVGTVVPTVRSWHIAQICNATQLIINCSKLEVETPLSISRHRIALHHILT